MESEYCGIFRVELVTKNVVLGSSGTHLMHMRVKKHKCFPVNFATFLRTSFLQNTSGRLHLRVFGYVWSSWEYLDFVSVMRVMLCTRNLELGEVDTKREDSLSLSVFIERSTSLKSDFHVPENFAKLKFSSVFFKKIPSFICLVFKNKNKWSLKV